MIQMAVKIIKLGSVVGLFLLTLVCPTSVHAQEPIVLTDDQDEYPLGLNLEILEDPSGELSIEQVSSPQYDGMFTPSQDEVPNYGYTDFAYWVRFRVRNEASSTRQWRLVNNFTNIHYIDFYSSVPGGDALERPAGFERTQTGVLLPFDTRDVRDYRFVFKLPLSLGAERTVYLRFKTGTSMTLDFTLWSSLDVTRQLQQMLLPSDEELRQVGGWTLQGLWNQRKKWAGIIMTCCNTTGR
jgi:hypothetical protein